MSTCYPAKRADVPPELGVSRTFSRCASCSSQSSFVTQAPDVCQHLGVDPCELAWHHHKHKPTQALLMFPPGCDDFEQKQSLVGEGSLPKTQRKMFKNSSVCISGRHRCASLCIQEHHQSSAQMKPLFPDYHWPLVTVRVCK